MTKIIMKKNGIKVEDFNDPSDAADFMLNNKTGLGLPKGFMLYAEPDKGFSWEVFPIRFGWKGNFYIFESKES